MAREQQIRSAILRPRRQEQRDSARVACLELLCSAQGLVRLAFGKVDLAAASVDTKAEPEAPRQVRARTPRAQDQEWECMEETVFRISDIAEDISVRARMPSRAACA